MTILAGDSSAIQQRVGAVAKNCQILSMPLDRFTVSVPHKLQLAQELHEHRLFLCERTWYHVVWRRERSSRPDRCCRGRTTFVKRSSPRQSLTTHDGLVLPPGAAAATEVPKASDTTALSALRPIPSTVCSTLSSMRCEMTLHLPASATEASKRMWILAYQAQRSRNAFLRGEGVVSG
jgi:hypothetical protein